MVIVKFEAEHIKKLKVVSITPTGAIVDLTGDNEQGKTSIMDAIWWALTGTKHIQDQPIHEGEESAFVKLDLGKLKVTRTFTARQDGDYNTYLTIQNEDGFEATKPQRLLDAIVGELTFDPLAFTRLRPQEQIDKIKALAPSVDFAALDQAEVDAFEARTVVNRRVSELRAQVAGIQIPDGAPTDRVDDSKMLADMETAAAFNQDVARQKAERENKQARITNLRTEAHQLREQAEALIMQAAEKEQWASDAAVLLREAGDLPELIDISQVRRDIDAARANNEIVAKVEARAALLKGVEEAQAEADALTAKISEAKQAKADAIAAAGLPVKGLEFGDGRLMLDGLPFNQASAARQRAVAIDIAAALNPDLRVVFLRDASLLDTKSMRALAAKAEEHGMQIWCESVERERPGAIVIEDGAVKGVIPQAAE